MRTLILLLCFNIVYASAKEEKLTEHTLKAESGSEAAKAELSQFSFLEGSWHGTGFGAECDEMWSAPVGDCILGTFRMVKDNQLQFTEFCMIQRDNDGRVLLRLKHFNPDFSGWETKDKFVAFPLIKVESNKACFSGLTYALREDGSLNIWVAMQQKDGTYKELEFNLQSAHKTKCD